MSLKNSQSRLLAVAATLCLALAGFGAAAETRVDANARHPLKLDEAIELAFAQNPDLLAAAARIGEAEAKVAEAAANFYPRLTARVGYAYSDDPAQAFSYIVAQRRFDFGMDINHPGWVENFRPEIVGTWSLYRGGQDSYRKKAAELGVEAAELERSAIRNRLAAAVTAAYYALLSAPQQVNVARHSVTAVERELEHTKHRVAEGMALKADVLSLEVRAAEAREAELKAQNAIELARSALKTLLGASTDELINLIEPADRPAAHPDQAYARLLDQALAQRPEMQAAIQQSHIRREELQAERGARWPRVNAYAAYGQNSRSPDFAFSRDNVTLGVNAEVDLFSGGAVSARIAQAERRLSEAQALEQRTRLEIEDEVRRAFTTLEEALQRLKVAEAGAAAADEALRLVNEQYRGGTASVTRYLEAETDRADAALRAIVAAYESRVAQAQLQKAVGHWR
ncbi:outer membrane protein CyaE [Methylocaldum marinum]|uniref:Outer membrane protein CyaE n=1 Tax=Methylocaldum marinum TaxID=1432792 RepID=A0A250KUD1_9GAMM|nr:TolC family protein [Methylocaldum marinum]BBA34561.1 outer membrane protein CyaE [Methylocaldum marinum]